MLSQGRKKAPISAAAERKMKTDRFPFRRMLTCAACNYSLIGELQKGNVYYRCHSKQCRQTSLREESIEPPIKEFLQRLCFSEEEKRYFREKIGRMCESWASQRDDEIRSVKLRLDAVKDRLNRLTDAYLDGALDRSMFEERKQGLLGEQKMLEEQLAHLNQENGKGIERLEKFLELAGNASLSYELALPEEKREMIQIVTSNRRVAGKNLELEPSLPFREIANRFKDESCALDRTIPRTWNRLLPILANLSAFGQLPDLSAIACVQSHNTNSDRVFTA
jgi:site-specific DNA recombinase